jgi:hypothetical protein
MLPKCIHLALPAWVKVAFNFDCSPKWRIHVAGSRQTSREVSSPSHERFIQSVHIEQAMNICQACSPEIKAVPSLLLSSSDEGWSVAKVWASPWEPGHRQGALSIAMGAWASPWGPVHRHGGLGIAMGAWASPGGLGIAMGAWGREKILWHLLKWPWKSGIFEKTNKPPFKILAAFQLLLISACRFSHFRAQKAVFIKLESPATQSTPVAMTSVTS